MSKYRPYLVVVDAIQWCGYNEDEVRSFLGDRFVSITPAAGEQPAVLVFRDKYGRSQEAVGGSYLIRDERVGVRALDWATFIRTYQPITDAAALQMSASFASKEPNP